MAAVAPPSGSIAVPDPLQRLIIDVRTHQLPRIVRRGSGEETADDWGQESNGDDAERELHDTLARVDAMLSDWSMDAIDMANNAREREAWAQLVQRTKADVVQLKRQAQEALLEAHHLRQERQAREYAMKWKQQQQQQGGGAARNGLLGDMSTTQAERDRRRDGKLSDQTADDKLMTASGDVTEALQRAVKLMSTELEKSTYSAQLLDESTMTVQQATLQYTSFSDLVASSRKLIASMERADLVDAALLVASMLFFAFCILYILKVRIWDRGVGFLSFMVRIAGITRSRSAGEVSKKLRIAKEAAAAASAPASSSASSLSSSMSLSSASASASASSESQSISLGSLRDAAASASAAVASSIAVSAASLAASSKTTPDSLYITSSDTPPSDTNTASCASAAVASSLASSAASPATTGESTPDLPSTSETIPPSFAHHDEL